MSLLLLISGMGTPLPPPVPVTGVIQISSRIPSLIDIIDSQVITVNNVQDFNINIEIKSVLSLSTIEFFDYNIISLSIYFSKCILSII